MAQDAPVLHMLCGKAASGKSTLAAVLAEAPATVMISEDAWLSALYGHEMATIPDYLRCAARLEEIIAPHVVALLSAGISVVLDFQANTPERRGWLRAIAEAADAAHAFEWILRE